MTLPPFIHFSEVEAWGIRNKATGKWCENCDFPTRDEADAHLKAQYHREWIEQHEVARKSQGGLFA